MIDKMSTDRRLPMSQKLFFGFGHVLNDMCASLWFNYLLVYLHSVLKFTNAAAGTLLLIGQVADAMSTPIVGVESDRSSCCNCYPRRKSWHLFGTLMVVCSFIFVFNPCLVCTQETSDYAKFFYFAPIIVIFQIGWASTQISHLSLIPALSSCEHQRVELTSIRYGFTVASNFFVFGSASLLLWLVPIGGKDASKKLNALLDDVSKDNHSLFPVEISRLSPADVPIFRDLAIIMVVLGSFFSVGFHLGTKEPCDQDEAAAPTVNESGRAKESGIGSVESGTSAIEDDALESAQATTPLLGPSVEISLKSKDWFKEPNFYLVGGIYICVRLVTNVSLTYMGLYITDTLMLTKIHVALVPLSVYIISMFTSVIQKKMNKFMGRNVCLLLGFVVTVGFCVSLYFITRPTNLIHLYCTAVLLGIGTSILMVGSLSLTADMIGNELKTSAFVYGAMSFGDKLSNGVAVEVIQLIHPCERCCVSCVWFYRTILVFFIGGVAIMGLLLLFLSTFRKPNDLRFYIHADRITSVNRSQGYGGISDGQASLEYSQPLTNEN